MKPTLALLVIVLSLVWGFEGCVQDLGTLAPQKIDATDPLFIFQWHLKNTGQEGGTIGEDIHVEPVWNSCGLDGLCRGEGVNIVVVDVGVEVAHEDLAANIVPG